MEPKVQIPSTCKLVPEERRRQQKGGQHVRTGELVIMTLNAQGLNMPQKVEALKQTLWDLAVDVAVITESHLSS